MNKFWNDIIEPIIKQNNVNTIVEIDYEKGLNTKNILDYCKTNGSKVISINPSPNSDLNNYKIQYGDLFVLYEDISLNVLPKLHDYQCVLINGDPNWYTVYNELKIIEKNSEKFPIIFLHNVSWPYDRRDLYHFPEEIPSEFINNYKKMGIDIYSDELKENGVNNQLYNSEDYNTLRNGVLTAIDDFLSETKLNLAFIEIPIMNGLGIIMEDKLKEPISKIVDNSEIFRSSEKFYAKKINDLIVYYQEMNEDINRLSKNNIQLKEVVNKLETEKKTLIKKHDELIEDYDEINLSLSKDYSNLKETVTQLENKNKQLLKYNEGAVLKIKEKNNENKKIISKYNVLEQQYDDKLNEIFIQKNLIKEKEQENEFIYNLNKLEKKDNEKLSLNNHNLRNENIKLKNEIKYLKKINSINENELSDNEKLIKQVKSKNNDLKHNIYALQEINKNLENENIILEKINSKNMDLISKEKNNQEDITKNFNNELMILQDENQKLKLRNNNLTKSKQDMHNQLTKLKNFNAQLIERNEKLSNTKEDLFNDFVIKKRENKELLNKINDYKNKQESLIKEVDDYKNENTDLTQLINEFENSKSWKITRPLRKIRNLTRRNK